MSDTQSQLIELQTQMAFQEDLLEALDRRVVAQDSEIRQLNKKLLALQTLCQQLSDAFESHSVAGTGPAAHDERPPHY